MPGNYAALEAAPNLKARALAESILSDLKTWYRQTGGHSEQWFPLTDRIVLAMDEYYRARVEVERPL